MKASGLADDARIIDVAKSTKFVNENLKALVLHFLYGNTSMSKHEITQEIFRRQGVSVNPSRIDMLLGSLKGQGLIEETKRELATVYALTDEGREVAKREKLSGAKTLL